MRDIKISLKAMYDTFNGQLKHGEILKEIDGEFEYYELLTSKGTVYMDGEDCTIINSGDFGYEIMNVWGEKDMTFTLTHEEYDIGVFKNNLK